jgi:hypothetical protein
MDCLQASLLIKVMCEHKAVNMPNIRLLHGFFMFGQQLEGKPVGKLNLKKHFTTETQSHREK